MKTSMDRAGRLIVPKEILRKSGIKPGMPLEVRCENGTIEISPAFLEINLECREQLLVAVPIKAVPSLSMNTVERVRKKLRRECSADSI